MTNVIVRLSRGLGPLGSNSTPEQRVAHAAIDDVRRAMRVLEKIAKDESKLSDDLVRAENKRLAENTLKQLRGK